MQLSYHKKRDTNSLTTKVLKFYSMFLHGQDFSSLNPLMSGGNKRSHTLKQTCTFKLQVYLSMYGLLLPPALKS